MEQETDALSRLCQALRIGSPYRWQHAAFEWLLRGQTPAQVKVPTAAGKTMMLLAFVAALATQALKGRVTLPRRLVLVVNRRALVDEATRLCERLCDVLTTDESVADLAGALAGLSFCGQPLAVSTLRGQWADNGAWSLDPACPALILATPDMLGSRLLFRGYGVGRSRSATHAGLLGVDTLVIHDEAHLAPAFTYLLRQVEAQAAVGAAMLGRPPLQVIEMTATLATRAPRPALVCNVADDPALKRRMQAEKRLRLSALPLNGAKPDAACNAVADELSRRALALRHDRSKTGGPQSVAVFVSRPRSAERLVAALRKAGVPDRAILLLTGTLRGHERAGLAAQDAFQCFATDAEQRRAAQSRLGDEQAFFVATAAGEIGLDIDADVGLFDLSTLDRFIQRAGRINRRGHALGAITVVHAQGQECPELLQTPCQRALALLASLPEAARSSELASPGASDVAEEPADPWHDASPLALSSLLDNPAYADAVEPPPRMRSLEPALLHLYALTSLRLDELGAPDPSLFIHGLEPEGAELHLAWRTFPARQAGIQAWPQWMDVWPLSRQETATVPLDAGRKLLEVLLARAVSRAVGGGVEAEPLAARLDAQGQWSADGLWRPGQPMGAWLRGLRPGSTVLLATVLGGLAQGLPSESATDVVLDVSGQHTDANGLQRQGVVALHARHQQDDDGGRWSGRLLEASDASGHTSPAADEAADQARTAADSASPPAQALEPGVTFDTLDDLLAHLVLDQTIIFHDGPDQASVGNWQGTVHCWVGQPGVRSPDSEDLAALASTNRLLDEHLQLAGLAAARLSDRLGLPNGLAAELSAAARAHDEGKARTCWQRALGNAPPALALAKSQRTGFNHRINQGYRHELGSLVAPSATGPLLSPLARHLVASHHGWARPGFRAEALQHPGCAGAAADAAHQFGQLHHALGPWALAWLEAILKAADVLAEVQAAQLLAAEPPPVSASASAPAAVSIVAEGPPSSPLWRLPVDVLNFGEYLAALGLVALLARQPQPFTVAWQGDTLVLGGVDDARVLQALAEVAGAQVVPDELACSDTQLKDAYPPLRLVPAGAERADLPLNPWLQPRFDDKSRWKLGAGRTQARATLVSLLQACSRLLAHPAFSVRSLFSQGGGQVEAEASKFRFDAATNWTAQDAGFSLNEDDRFKSVRPWVELLSTVGLQFAFAPPRDASLRYHCWSEPLPPVLVLAAVRGLLPGCGPAIEARIVRTSEQFKDIFPSQRPPEERTPACPTLLMVI